MDLLDLTWVDRFYSTTLICASFTPSRLAVSATRVRTLSAKSSGLPLATSIVSSLAVVTVMGQSLLFFRDRLLPAFMDHLLRYQASQYCLLVLQFSALSKIGLPGLRGGPWVISSP